MAGVRRVLRLATRLSFRNHASPMLRASLRQAASAPILTFDPALHWPTDLPGDASPALSAPRSSVASSDLPDDHDWHQLDLAFDKYTNVFELDGPSPDDPTFAWQLDPVKTESAASRFGSVPFPHSPSLDPVDASYPPLTLPYNPFPRPSPLYPYPVFPVDDTYPYADQQPQSPDDLSLYGSPWNVAAVPPRATDSAAFPAAVPLAIRPLMLAHRTSLPASLPSSSPYQQHFFQHSAPEPRSPLRHHMERRYTTTIAAGDDGAVRKRKRSAPDDILALDKPPQRSELHPPKQAPSTWQVFFADWLEDHRARNPRTKLNVAQAAKEAGQVYHNLNVEDRDRLKRRAQAAKEDREREVAEWKRKLTPDDIKRENAFRAAQRKAGKSRKGNLKDPNAPKKPLSAYFMFLQKIRSSPQLVDEVFGDETETTKQSVLAAAKWRSLSDDDKKPFLIQAEHEKIEYENARRVYEKHSPGALYRSSGEIGQNGSSTSVLAYPPFTTDVASDDDGETSEGYSDLAEET